MLIKTPDSWAETPSGMKTLDLEFLSSCSDAFCALFSERNADLEMVESSVLRLQMGTLRPGEWSGCPRVTQLVSGRCRSGGRGNSGCSHHREGFGLSGCEASPDKLTPEFCFRSSWHTVLATATGDLLPYFTTDINSVFPNKTPIRYMLNENKLILMRISLTVFLDVACFTW